MKFVYLLVAVVITACVMDSSCNNGAAEKAVITANDTAVSDIVLTDTSNLIAYRNTDSVAAVFVSTAENTTDTYDSLEKELVRGTAKLMKQNDSLYRELVRAQFMIAKARYYLKITLRNPGQTKFLKGWMRRALEVK